MTDNQLDPGALLKVLEAEEQEDELFDLLWGEDYVRCLPQDLGVWFAPEDREAATKAGGNLWKKPKNSDVWERIVRERQKWWDEVNGPTPEVRAKLSAPLSEPQPKPRKKRNSPVSATYPANQTMAVPGSCGR